MPSSRARVPVVTVNPLPTFLFAVVPCPVIVNVSEPTVPTIEVTSEANTSLSPS